MPEIKIVSWSENDFELVRSILFTTWLDTYTFIPKEDLLSYLNEQYSDENLQKIFSNPMSKGYFIRVDDVPCGWMRTNINKEENRFYISSLYVLPDKQGLGLGKKLFIRAEEDAALAGFEEVWLGVMRKNEKSVKWYKKIGFSFPIIEPFQMGKTKVEHLIGYKKINFSKMVKASQKNPTKE